jgi:hypothetical protein
MKKSPGIAMLTILAGGIYLMATSSSTATQAARAGDFLNSIGVNTHIDFTGTAYGNLQTVESALNFVGIKNVRDSLNNTKDIGTNGWWQQVANATGVKFDAFLPEGSPSAMQNSLQYIQQVAPQHILTSIEGGNEEDDAYAVSNGNSLSYTAQYEQTVYSVGQSLGLPVINMSFGTGWGTNPTQGDYANVGNISAYSNYANGHVYYGTGNPPASTIAMVNSLAQISSNHPVIITETGWYTTGSSDVNSVSETVQAKYTLDALMDAYKAGDVKTYLYELLDQKTGDGYSEDNFGLFHSDGTPKLAATALHNLTTLLADTGSNSATFTPGSLSYSLSGTTSSDNSMLLEKSDGTYWLAIWDETRLSGPTSSTNINVANQTITLNLGSTATSIQVFDPLTGTTAVQSVNNASTAQISVPDHPVLVEIITSGSGSTSGTGTTGSGSTGSTGGTSTGGTLTSNDLSIAMPATLAATANTAVQVAATISDAWAAQHSGTMALNIAATGGTVTMTDGSGHAVAGSGTNAIHVYGSLAQLNADLATMSFTGATGSDSVSVNVWNQAGVQTTVSTAINVTAAAVSSGSGGTSNTTSIATPSSLSMTAGSAVQMPGVNITDDWATQHSGNVTLNITTNGGVVSMLNSNGQTVAGSGTSAIHISGTLAQINADLATLSYQGLGNAGTDTISVNMWNQAGVSTTQTIAVNNLVSGDVTNNANNAILSATTGHSLTGSGTNDIFYFTPQNTGNSSTPDHITDFSQASGDKIDLHGFGLTAANFNSTGALSGSKSVTFQQTTDIAGHSNTMVMIETNGSHTPQYEIQLDNVHATLHASDFIFA